jgi:hypothetical protein
VDRNARLSVVQLFNGFDEDEIDAFVGAPTLHPSRAAQYIESLHDRWMYRPAAPFAQRAGIAGSSSEHKEMIHP